jgi:transcriptional regulator with XRE-family HTH domain
MRRIVLFCAADLRFFCVGTMAHAGEVHQAPAVREGLPNHQPLGNRIKEVFSLLREGMLFRGTISERLRFCRTLRGWSQEEAAVHARVPMAKIMEIESDLASDPPISVVVKLGLAYQVTVAELIGDVDRPPAWMVEAYRRTAAPLDRRTLEPLLRPVLNQLQEEFSRKVRLGSLAGLKQTSFSAKVIFCFTMMLEKGLTVAEIATLVDLQTEVVEAVLTGQEASLDLIGSLDRLMGATCCWFRTGELDPPSVSPFVYGLGVGNGFGHDRFMFGCCGLRPM